MASSLPFACRCGSVRGKLATSDAPPIRAVCYCRDCRAYVRHLGQAADLDEAGGTEVVQTLPAAVIIDVGADSLRALTMTQGGIHRYYAECCGVPIANSAPTPRLPFCGVIGARLGNSAIRDEKLGRIAFAAFKKSATGRPIARPGLVRHAAAIAKLVIPATMFGPADTPFFVGGHPLSAPRQLTPGERASAYA